MSSHDDGERAGAERHFGAQELMTLGGTVAAMAVAAETGLLDALLERDDSIDGFAACLGLAPRAVEAMLRVLVTHGLASPYAEDRFGASRAVRATVAASPGGALGTLSIWQSLRSFARSGVAYTAHPSGATTRAHVYPGVVPKLADATAAAAAVLAERLCAASPLPQRVLDIGAGAGGWSLAIAARTPGCHVTALDLEPVLPRFMERARDHGLGERVATLAGDYHEVALDRAAYDTVILANVLHLESDAAACALVARGAEALAADGRLVVVDCLADPGSRTEQRFAASYNLHLTLRLPHGAAYPRARFEAWLRAAGLSHLELVDLGDGPMRALVARRAPRHQGSIVDLAVAADCARFGGKAAGLAALVVAGLPVPDGLAIDAATVAALVAGEPDALAALRLALPALGQRALAVRSSALCEDGSAASFAGQHLSVLGVQGFDAVLEAVRRVHASGASASAAAYRARLGAATTAEVAVGVVVQHLLAPRCAGVLFTANPLGGADERVIEASWGLGEVVVQGLVTPDLFRLARGGHVLEQRAGHKDLAIELGPDGVTREVGIDAARATVPCLDERTLAALDLLATRCERVHEGRALDLEWALTDDGELHLLQCRPVTALAGR